MADPGLGEATDSLDSVVRRAEEAERLEVGKGRVEDRLDPRGEDRPCGLVAAADGRELGTL